MRANLFLAVFLSASIFPMGTASAQWFSQGMYCPGYLCPPRAPDFYNTPPFAYTNCYGVTYAPNWNVYPSFPPFNGMLPAPNMMLVQQMMQTGMTPGGMMLQQQQQQQGQPGIAGFPSHVYARSPRDYFMVDTDPRATPYYYGLTGRRDFYMRDYDTRGSTYNYNNYNAQDNSATTVPPVPDERVEPRPPVPNPPIPMPEKEKEKDRDTSGDDRRDPPSDR